MLQSSSYRARRAFRVAEPDDERLQHYAPHYFIELEDGGVLHLRGDVLEPELNAPAFQESEADQIPDDEEIITSKTYDQLKMERIKNYVTNPQM